MPSLGGCMTSVFNSLALYQLIIITTERMFSNVLAMLQAFIACICSFAMLAHQKVLF